MRIVLIGSGNTATVLGEKLVESGHQILQVFGRNEVNASLLARKLSAEAIIRPEKIKSDADLYLAAISDGSLAGLEDWLSLDEQLIVHTAGSVSIEVLSGVSKNYGVMYPLQTLRKEIKPSSIPFLVDANTDANKIWVSRFAETISPSVHYADDKYRAKIHLAAVIANNFSNHLFAQAERFCINKGVDFSLLLPLITETTNRLYQYSPGDVQTGPASRKDYKTIEAHLSMLKDHPALEKLYASFTESIIQSR